MHMPYSCFSCEHRPGMSYNMVQGPYNPGDCVLTYAPDPQSYHDRQSGGMGGLVDVQHLLELGLGANTI